MTKGYLASYVSADYKHVHETRRLFDFIELISEDWRIATVGQRRITKSEHQLQLNYFFQKLYSKSVLDREILINNVPVTNLSLSLLINCCSSKLPLPVSLSLLSMTCITLFRLTPVSRTARTMGSSIRARTSRASTWCSKRKRSTSFFSLKGKNCFIHIFIY